MATVNETFSAEDKWTILNSMFEELGLVRQHLDSYNHFIKIGLQQVVDEERLINPDDISGMYVELDKITLGEPEIKEADGSTSSIWPMDARTRNLTYAAPLHLKMTPRYPEENTNTLVPGTVRKLQGTGATTVYVGQLPVMLKSDRCRLTMNNPDDTVLIQNAEDPKDSGGYFIINGSERVLVTQEDLAPNRILVERLSGKSATSLAKVFSTLAVSRPLKSIELNVLREPETPSKFSFIVSAGLLVVSI
ncbi:MAG: hypothetical protein IH840_04210 [Candidatus Heimdallarchaeota archaeon]|nr:hypothetical protein [Candidatus Heimdallarchaeota archaeon]